MKPINRAQWLRKWKEDLLHAWDVGVDPNGYPIEQETEEEFIEACWQSFDESQTNDVLNDMEIRDGL